MTPRSVPPSPPARESLADSVHASLLAWLMDGNARPGESLSIDGLARTLGVSPTPVREAMARIEGTGLVERVAMRGYRVAGLLTPREVEELMDARLLLECHNAAAAVAHVDDELLDQLTDTVRRMEKAPKGPSFADYQDYHRADNEFHRLLNRAGGNAFLAEAFEGLNGQVQRFRLRLVGDGVTDAEMAIVEHDALVRALRERDAEAVAARMREHLEAVRSRAMADSAAAGHASAAGS